MDATHPAIISRETFKRANTLLQRRASTKGMAKKKYLLTKLVYCGHCGSVFCRKEYKSGYVTWACRTHNFQAQKCPMGRIPEKEIYAAFVRMYNKLKLHRGIILKPALTQLQDLNEALQRGNPAMLEINKAIAAASEQSYKVSILQSKGLLDAAVCSAKLLDIEARLTELRRERRRLLKDEAIEEVMDTLRQTADLMHNGPECLEHFDEILFADLVDKITAESPTRIRFHLYGGIELTEQLQEVRR